MAETSQQFRTRVNGITPSDSQKVKELSSQLIDLITLVKQMACAQVQPSVPVEEVNYVGYQVGRKDDP